MAKKITLLMIVMLLVSALVFVSCSQNAGPSGGTDDEDDREPVVNCVDTISENLLENGSFATTDLKELSDLEDAAEVRVVDGALYVDTGAIDYGQVHIDLTKYYARGKSYYIQASFKNVPTLNTEENYDKYSSRLDMTAHIDFTVVSGAVMDAVDTHPKWQGYYDCPDIYEGGLLEEGDEALEAFDDFLNDDTYAPVIANGLEINDTEFVTVGAILDAETIESLLKNTTQKYPNGDEYPTMAKFLINFYVGDGKDTSYYKYLLDDIIIYDLNDDIDIDEDAFWVKAEAAQS